MFFPLNLAKDTETHIYGIANRANRGIAQMAQISHLIDADLQTPFDLTEYAGALADVKRITRGQWITLVELLLPDLPVKVSFSQRTPKGTLYVRVHDGSRYSIDCRAKLQKID
jgi:hypothetical protein